MSTISKADGRLPCGVRLAYRTMADIGSKATCGNPAVTPAGFCRMHDPETRPKRDKHGRIMPKSTPDQEGR